MGGWVGVFVRTHTRNVRDDIIDEFPMGYPNINGFSSHLHEITCLLRIHVRTRA